MGEFESKKEYVIHLLKAILVTNQVPYHTSQIIFWASLNSKITWKYRQGKSMSLYNFVPSIHAGFSNVLLLIQVLSTKG